MENNNISSSFQSGLLGLSLIARLLQKSIDLSQLLHEFEPEVESPPELIDTQLQRVAKSIGYKSKSYQTSIEKLDSKVFPILARHLDGHYFVIAKPQQVQLERDSLDTLTEGHYLLLAPRSVLLKASELFGFKWSQTILVDGREVPLSAGMSVSAEIKTGSRRLIKFLLSPVIQHLDEGARER
ncbi:cysteine peptidase family C39 domain-containing protein [Pseudoalteromonas sp. DL2-H2.2]|uniref:cysteine peptidase family C39 domain-containing protein n=1 Tax=Pseudoalteromonas sp. DL2-H2.2 TaxID=2908889 RepID=UPI001F337CC0|nr:cysteine peptidase family C39 domain-containing protein [Pseudoalteromonas sp. DL2-H2.2]MCF2909598.1 cysteine peptidase family C39 domain-containing protein [Pseudoalteromonas sp. DL2-H2.2]